MHRLGGIDLPERVAPNAPRAVGELLTAAGCTGAAGVLRMLIDGVLPDAAPFALVFPAALLSTLLGGWRAGLAALAMLEVGVWYLVLPPRLSFTPLPPAEIANLLLNAISGGLVVLVAQGFRTASRRADQERSAKLEQRDLLLRELNHRVKNNFQMVSGLLEMQRRAARDASAVEALDRVLHRVHSLAQAHAALYAPSHDPGAVDLARYLEDLCRSLSDSLLLNNLVHLNCDCEAGLATPDRAAAIGVVVNELVTNAAKHAFPEGRHGAIEVRLARAARGWRLTVSDDGIGLGASSSAKGSGLGRRLVEAFARQAGGVVREVRSDPGATFVIDLA